MSGFPAKTTTTYSLWFKAKGQDWRPWSGEKLDKARAEAGRDACKKKFPRAETAVVRKTVTLKAVEKG